MKRIVAAIVVIGFLSACASGTNIPTSTHLQPSPLALPAQMASPISTPHSFSVVQFLDLQLAGFPEEQAIEFGIGLFPWDVYALDKDVVFLFGELRIPAMSIRSLLLHSDDGGKHWYEVMQPEPGSATTELFFVDDGHGWALVVWTVEGAGPANLYHTKDYGKSWQKLSDIPFFGGHSFTFDLQFSDKQHGQVKAEKMLDRANHHCCTLSSTDGGLTWNETDDCGECDYGMRRQDVVLARDGSQWQVEVDSFDVSKELCRVKISRRLSSENTWTVVSSIPTYFEYSSGQLVVPGQQNQ